MRAVYAPMVTRQHMAPSRALVVEYALCADRWRGWVGQEAMTIVAVLASVPGRRSESLTGKRKE